MRAFPCLVLFIGCQSVYAQLALLRQDVPAGDRPSTVVVGDFNADSRPDFAVNGATGLSVLFNLGGGSFSRPVITPGEIHPQFGPTPSNYTVAADFNRDGWIDLVGSISTSTPPQPPTRTARLLLGRGDGTFTQRDIEVASGGLVSATGDFNGDGLPDLVSGEGESTVILIGNGEGYFVRGARVDASFARVADLNRDGFSDLATVLPGSRLAVWLNRGDATFHPPVETPDADLGVVADFNKDGIPDMAARTEMLLGKGDGTFRPIRYVPSRRGFPMPFAASDFDGDGHMDMAGWLSSEGDDRNYISVYAGKGDGTFQLPVDYLAGVATTGQVAADMDGDGRLDLVTANFRSNSLTMFLPRSPGPSLNRAVSAASGTAVVTPGSLATVYAQTGATRTETAGAPYPTTLSGISLAVSDSAGTSLPLGLAFVSPNQINFHIPAGVALGEASLVLTNAGGTTTIAGMHVSAVAPALFMVSHANSTPAATAYRLAPDGRQTPVPVFNCFGPPGVSPFSCGPAQIRLSGDPIYLSFYGTGFRGANKENLTVSVGGMQLPVEFVGSEGTSGIDRIDVRLVQTRPIPQWFFTIELNGVAANSALLQITP